MLAIWVEGKAGAILNNMRPTNNTEVFIIFYSSFLFGWRGHISFRTTRTRCIQTFIFIILILFGKKLMRKPAQFFMATFFALLQKEWAHDAFLR
jgi:hypothetical protein